MPPRTKRNAASRRQHAPAQQSSPFPEPQDLLSFDSDAPPQTTYDSPSPAVFELEPPPSDPEAGRASAAILPESRLLAPAGFPKHPYARDEPLRVAEEEPYAGGTGMRLYEGASESDIDDGGPASPSTSPPGPSSVSTGNFAIADAPDLARAGISQLAAAEDTTSDDSSLGRSVGHIRSPVLAR